jgi:hypothetical protein
VLGDGALLALDNARSDQSTRPRYLAVE